MIRTVTSSPGRVSIVIPVMDEVENVGPLAGALRDVMESTEREWEMIFVDDGSTDGTGLVLQKLALGDPRVRVIGFRRNYGQTAALQAGFDLAEGDVIVTIDGDRQNDPRDIPMMLSRLDEGYDLVHGWRIDRRDALLHRRLPSRIANWLISRVTRFPIHDLGCTLKVIRREIVDELRLYGEMHRFIPILAHQRGARCLEVATRHHPRRAGRTKYGLGRTSRVILDLITVKYMLDYFASPMKLFGRVGLMAALAAVGLATAALVMKLFAGVDLTGNPFSLASVLLTLAAIQFMSLGLLGEVNARIYFESQQKTHYAIRFKTNFARPEPDPAGRRDARAMRRVRWSPES